MAYTDKLRVVYGDYTLGVHGEGFDYMKEAIPLKLEKYYPLGKDFVMEYKVLK